jgi:hypothetical protein
VRFNEQQKLSRTAAFMRADAKQMTEPAAGILVDLFMKTRIAAIFPIVMCACSCATSTTIESSWTDPTHSEGSFQRVAVVALFDTASESREFEQNAAEQLEARGVAAVQSHSILEDERMYEQDKLRAKLADANVDAILIYRLIAVDERQVYRPPTDYLRMPPGVVRGDPYYWYYYPSWDYYWYWRSSRDVTRSAGYWEEHRYVVVESSLYDARKDQLVWTAKSSTMDDAQFAAVSSSIADRVTRELVAKEFVTGGDRTAAVR